MDYHETKCQICGVSFNISRFRTKREGFTGAWGNARGRNFDYIILMDEECNVKGCRNVTRDSFIDNHDSDEASSESGVESPYRSDRTILRKEHMSGRNCRLQDGYNGTRISAKAMRGCTTFQCLVQKSPEWTAEEDDESFEASGRFFLSGLSDHMPPNEMAIARVFPPRHGHDEVHVQNVYVQNEQPGPVIRNPRGMPFHPACLEVFKRVTLSRYGVIDLEALTSWWTVEGTYHQFLRFPRHPAVTDASERAWLHLRGDEFLAANPCFVPELPSILSSSTDKDTASVLPSETASPEVTGTKKTPATDVFLKLPSEINHEIALHLSFTDICNLRLVTRTFHGLPMSLFHKLVLRDMPWFYEAWTSLPLSPWAATTAKKLASLEEPNTEELQIPQISRTGTNWRHLGCQLERGKMVIPGLRNRTRIWKDCHEILNRVDKYRLEGTIDPRE